MSGSSPKKPSMAAKYRSPNSTITRHTTTYDYINPSKYTNSLTDKIVLITGAGRGIGRATVLSFAAAGASVACISRTPSDLSAVVSEIQERGYPQAIAIPADVTDPTAPARIIQEVESKLGKIDILINNAGTSRISDLEHETDMTAAFRVLDVNLKGPLALTHAVLPSMIVRKRGGTVINIVSVLATINLPYFSIYSAAKAGLIRATEILDLEFRTHGIRTYAVAPGMVADTTLGRGAINENAMREVEAMRNFVEEFGPSMTDQLALPADSLVALVADEDAGCLSGRYVDVTEDLGEVLGEAKKGKLEREGLYTLKVETL